MASATGNCAMVQYSDKKIYINNCGSHLFFICRKYPTYYYDYPFIPEAKTWSEAQEYCRTNYADLASFSSSYLKNVVREMEFPIWIGLHRDGAAWSWSLGDSKYRNWFTGEPSNSGDCGSIYSISKKMASQNCDTRLPFLCISDNMVLVKENKNWEEALEHCRGLRSSTNNVRYDLLSLQPEDQQDLIMTKVMQADTKEVWTGLRFLAGEWLWVNGADMLHTDLPLCPAPHQHCGILSKNSAGGMEARDCSERKNFICYSYTP
ncbi:secretory phospholipase A2 receptor-like [Fundulus heteroclitus]|uniref:secretory phospholipase A2 receptor-like n=1 Tax=Fundulus heteroclitus TaxID=8078 RepID=UPI00165C370C|nr:secretory phospholipase A2 receptor-like [Fundulus heteroclitus]